MTEAPAKPQSNRAAAGCGCLIVIGVIAAGVRFCSRPRADKEPAGPPRAAEIAAYKAGVAAIVELGRPCDNAVSDAAASMKEGDIYAGYSRAVDAKAACRDASDKTLSFDFSSVISRRRRDILNDMRDTCATAYSERGDRLAAIAAVLNGDSSPKAMDAVTRARDAAEAGMSQCVVAMVADGQKAGFDSLAAMPTK